MKKAEVFKMVKEFNALNLEIERTTSKKEKDMLMNEATYLFNTLIENRDNYKVFISQRTGKCFVRYE